MNLVCSVIFDSEDKPFFVVHPPNELTKAVITLNLAEAKQISDEYAATVIKRKLEPAVKKPEKL